MRHGIAQCDVRVSVLSAGGGDSSLLEIQSDGGSFGDAWGHEGRMFDRLVDALDAQP